MLLSSVILTKIYCKYNNIILTHFLKDPVNECLKSLVNVEFFYCNIFLKVTYNIVKKVFVCLFVFVVSNVVRLIKFFTVINKRFLLLLY